MFGVSKFLFFQVVILVFYLQWDTDLHTPSQSEPSTIVAESPGRCLRRALDQKVRNLRKMLSGDEDITTELDRVVCRLMKLALHSSAGREAPPPSRWMQCKLLDLLTLTEKAITRRQSCFIESMPLKAIDDKKHSRDMREQDRRVKQIVAKYRYLLQPLEKMTNTGDCNNSPVTDVENEDEYLSIASDDFPRENEYTMGMYPSLVIPRPVFSTDAFEAVESTPDVYPFERTKAWLADDVEVVPYPNQDVNYETISSGDTDASGCNARQKHKKSSKKHKTSNKAIRKSVEYPCKASLSKTSYKTKRDKKNSKTRIVKNVSKNNSRYYNDIVANPDGAYSSLEYDNHNVSRKDKNHQTFNMKISQPIPDSFMHLSDFKGESDNALNTVMKHIDDPSLVISKASSSCISATEKSFHVDIVMQDFEETIALRRTIATDTKVAPEKRTIDNDDGVAVMADLDEKLKHETKHEGSSENVHSQTFFLNDINEPSTSKGIRHNVSMDVQCGPDTFATFPLTTTSTSLATISQGFSTGIEIKDVRTEGNVKGIDFGTSTQETDNLTTITPRMRSVGIKIKDSDVNLNSHSECTMTVPDCVPQSGATAVHSGAGHSAMSINETKVVRPILSLLKREDSASEFCTPSVVSASETSYMNESKHTTNAMVEYLTNNEIDSRLESPSIFNKLSCGGVHIHSYQDRQVSEDIIYQGEWQRYRAKVQKARKKINSFTTLRKSNEARKTKEIIKEKKVNTKEKVFRKKQEKKQIEAKPREPTQMQNVNLNKLSNEENNGEDKKTRVKSAVNILDKTNKQKIIPRPLKALLSTKMASKMAMSTKNTKSSFTAKRSAILLKKDNDVPQKNHKSYIPLYLKRTQLSRGDKDKLNKSLDSASEIPAGNKNKIAPLMRSKTEEISKDLLKLSKDLRVNIRYVVCRNELEDNVKAPDEQTSENSKDAVKRSISPSYSVNSSTCSSPNSIATVRAASTRSRSTSKRHSTSSHKSNVTNSESDNPTPTKTKKNVKRHKSVKKMENNKENIPESTKNFVNKDKGKICKFPGKPKTICRAQIDTECSSPPLSRQKAQISNKSNVKISSRGNSAERRTSISPTVSKKRSLKSDSSLIYDDFILSESESLKTSDASNMVLVLRPQQNYEDLIKTRNISQSLTHSAFAVKSNSNNSLMATLIQNSSGQSNANNILNSMRQLLEETLDEIIIPHGLMRHLSSETVNFCNDDIKKTNDDRVSSPGMKTGVGFIETSRDDKKDLLKRTFDNVLGDESTVSLNDNMFNRMTVSDLDLLSFKSVTSGSKYSEYYLADNEFNTSQEIDQALTQNTTPVHDIFERREQNLMQSTPGALAIQAFSGFSLDAEPVTGDQSDPIGLLDSEIGSMTVEISRQATSEEVFISGRSSETYQSCVVDDVDTVVPNWLFQVISQQHSVDNYREPPHLGPVPAPLDDPMYDANGNIVEPSILGVGAGAGDGRGMHSDHSQDSSGRGTSLSSSDTSSGPQSEVSTILIEPSAQFELLRDPMTSSAVMPPDAHHSLDHEVGRLANSHDVRVRITNRVSDIDADVSSIDTDVPDLSDY